MVAALLATVLMMACSPASAPEVPRTRGVGVQLFMWNWPSVARECTEVLGPNQFDYVLLSPAQEHITGDAWWIAYQPVSYQIASQLGTREQFKQMVDACHSAGVKVLADAVINHMAGVDGGTGWAGTRFRHYDYPGLYGRDDFHRCGTPDDDIANYSDATQVQTCELSNLADLVTSSPRVREKITGYLNDLRSLGVDGFRIDAAKHMAAADVNAIVKGITTSPEPPIIISEVIRAGGEPIQPEEYLDAGGVFAFQIARDLKGIIAGGSLGLVAEASDGDVPSDKAYTFVTNHDTERNGQTLSYKDAAAFQLGTVLLLASPYGHPKVYGGYAFSSNDLGPARDANGQVSDVRCADGPKEAYSDQEWVCEHRWPTTVGMADWVSVVGDAPIDRVWNEGSMAAWSRGDRGLIVASGENETKTVTVPTGLPDGTYCDALTAPTLASGQPRCAEGGLTVKEGQVSLTIAPMSAVALHIGLRR